jgi:acyl carrier protein
MTPDLNSLTEVFRDVFDRPDITLNLDTTARDIPEWDSLMHIQIIVAVEKKFEVRFAPGEIESLKNVGQFLELISKKKNRPS